MNNTALLLKNVSVMHKDEYLIKNLSLLIERGETVCIKCSSKKYRNALCDIIMGYRKIFDGRAIILKTDINSDRALLYNVIGYADGELYINPDMSIKSLFKLNLKMYKHEIKSRTNKLLEVFKIDVNRKYKSLNESDRACVIIILAVAHNPSLVVFNDISMQLSETAKKAFVALIKEMKQSLTTILFIGSNVNDIFPISDKVYVYSDGALQDTADKKVLEVM